jgi:Skp family chaperone for outer membrane proteins
MKKIISIAIASLLVAGSIFAQKANSIGTVNMERLMEDYVSYQAALKKVEGAAKTAQEEIDSFKAKLGLDAIEVKVQELQETVQNPATADIARQNAEAEVQKLIAENQASIQQLNAYGTQLQQQNDQNRNRILNPYQLKIREAVINVAKDKGYDLVVPIAPKKVTVPSDTGEDKEYAVFMGNNILYAGDSLEITDSVIALLNAE